MNIKHIFLVTILFLGSSMAMGQDPLYVDETDTRLGPDSQMGVRIDAGDVDGDGDVDIIVANGQHSAPPTIPLQDVMLQINDGNGHFTDEASIRLPPSAFGQQLANAVILGDVDGDGDLDAYVANGSSGGVLCTSLGSQNLLWINDGSGNYTDETFRLPVYPPDCSFDATFGDIDGDGDLDIVVANVGYGGLGEVNRILINDGINSGTFVDRTFSAFTSSPADITYTVALGDLDGDSDLDMVVGNAPASAPPNRFLRNDGGVFTDVGVTWTGYSPYRPVWDVKLADMNGDGSVDILMSNALDGLRMILMLNQGGWHFTVQTIYVSYQYGLDVADVDSDGDMDILVSLATPKHGGFPLRLLLNSGDSSPTFEDVTGGLAGYLAFGEDFFWDTAEAMFRFPSFVDVNNDSAPDIYLPTLVWWWWVGPGQTDFDRQDRLFINTLVPEPGEVKVAIDIKFCSNPNGFNCKGGGVMPMTVFGSDTLDVTDIDLTTVELCLASDDTTCIDASSLVNSGVEDRGDPTTDIGTAQCYIDPSTGVEQRYLNQDGLEDLELAWDKKEVVDVLFDDCDAFDKKEASPTLIIKALTTGGVDVVSTPVDDPGVDQIWRQR